MKLERPLFIAAMAGIVGVSALYIGTALGLLSTVTGHGEHVSTTGSGGSCGMNGDTSYTLVAGWNNPATGSIEPVNTDYMVFYDDVFQPIASGTLSSGQVTLTDTLFCGKEYRVIVGDGSSYYFAEETVKPTETSTVTNVNLKKVGTARITVGNRTVLGGQTQVSVDLQAGVDSMDATIEVQETDTGAYFGDGKFMVAVGGEKSNYTDFGLTSLDGLGVREISCPDNVIDEFSATYSIPKIKCFEVDKDLYNGELKRFQLRIVPASDFDESSASTISIMVNDLATYVKNGKLVAGYVDASGNDIGASVQYLANAIVPY